MGLLEGMYREEGGAFWTPGRLSSGVRVSAEEAKRGVMESVLHFVGIF